MTDATTVQSGPPCVAPSGKDGGGAPYDAGDPELRAAREQCRALLGELNRERTDAPGWDERLTACWVAAQNAVSSRPLLLRLWHNIFVGENFYANFSCTILDVRNFIGDNVLLAPGCGSTPLPPGGGSAAHQGWSSANRCVSATTSGLGQRRHLPGRHHGDNSVIGAGSVVTRDIPAGVVAVGNPAGSCAP